MNQVTRLLSGLTVLFHTRLFQVLDLLWICLFPQIFLVSSQTPSFSLALLAPSISNCSHSHHPTMTLPTPSSAVFLTLALTTVHHETQFTYLSYLLSDPPTRMEGP